MSLCALCLWLVLDDASCFVIKPTCLGRCLGHGLRAGDQVGLEDDGDQLSPFCRVDKRQSGQHDQASKNISLVASVGLAPARPPPQTCACPKPASRSPRLKTSRRCSVRCCSDQFPGSAEQTGQERDDQVHEEPSVLTELIDRQRAIEHVAGAPHPPRKRHKILLSRVVSILRQGEIHPCS